MNEEFEKIAKFWLEKGVAGFRLDAVKYFTNEHTDGIEFMKWFTLDVEDDTISPEDEEICDRINEYMSVAYYSEEFFNACGEIYERGFAKSVWSGVYSMLFQNGASLTEVTKHLQAILSPF